MTTQSLTLLLPGFQPRLDNDMLWPEMPALQMLLSKGDREPLRENFSTTLCAHFGLSAADGAELPVAALSALGDRVEASDGWWLHADPVHLVADRDQLFLSASDALGLNQNEADALVAELNKLYTDDGWEFVSATPHRWYLRLPKALGMHATSTAEAMGQRVGEVLPQGEDAMAWQRVMTEVQMLLHTSPVNTARSEQGRLAVNGVWFWGGGSLPEAGRGADWQYVVTEHPLARGLAQFYGLQVVSAVSAALDAAEGKVLWVEGEAQLGPDRLEQECFAPLLAMLQARQLSQLVIELPGQGRWRIDRAMLRRWWRRCKPLTTLLKGIE